MVRENKFKLYLLQKDSHVFFDSAENHRSPQRWPQCWTTIIDVIFHRITYYQDTIGTSISRGTRTHGMPFEYILNSILELLAWRRFECSKVDCLISGGDSSASMVFQKKKKNALSSKGLFGNNRMDSFGRRVAYGRTNWPGKIVYVLEKNSLSGTQPVDRGGGGGRWSSVETSARTRRAPDASVGEFF